MMQKVSIDLSIKQAEQLLEQLPVETKVVLVRRWEQEMWPQRLRDLLAQIDRRVQKHPRLAKEAMKVVGPARRAFYAARRHRR
jgi:hypothetical protein